MTEVVASEDVKMNEGEGVAEPVAGVSKVGSGGDGDVAMGDGDDHEKMVKAAKQSELLLSLSFIFCNSKMYLFIAKVEFYFADANLPYDK